MTTRDLHSLINESSSYVGPLWPLDRSIAVNPLLDRLDDDFVVATTELGRQLGVSPWPSDDHLAEAVRRGLGASSGEDVADVGEERPGTTLERASGVDSDVARNARRLVGQVILEAVCSQGDVPGDVLTRAAAALRDRASWMRGSASQREAVGALISGTSLADLVDRMGLFDDEAIVTELTAHFARLPGWAAWAKWNDLWSRRPHPSALTRGEFLTVSMAVDLAMLEAHPRSTDDLIATPISLTSATGESRLRELEDLVHTALLRAVRAENPSTGTPRWQIVTCIDVRSEPLRRALEKNHGVETFGFAGFFGIPAMVTPRGEREGHESLPVLVEANVNVSGGRQSGDVVDSTLAMSGTFAELTHEPGAMFALAEGTGWLAVPWILGRTFAVRRDDRLTRDAGEWTLEADDRATLAEGALRTMGLTTNFAPEVVFVGHASRSRANTHYAALDCGACAGHAGGTNAVVLADLLNDGDVRRTLAQRGIVIPAHTHFLAGEHDTTTETVTLFGDASSDLLSVFTEATNDVAMLRSGGQRVGPSKRLLRRRAGDWAETRPEWGLARNAAFVVAPRASFRGADLQGQCFMHSYDPDADDDGLILGSILAAPVVVAQWINASYYFSTVAPDVLGAGDKTLLNPVGDFGVISGDDPDLRLGLPWQSVAAGNRPWHLPVRLLVVIEAPLARTEAQIEMQPMVRRLVEGEWVRVVGRDNSTAPWNRWIPKHGWELW